MGGRTRTDWFCAVEVEFWRSAMPCLWVGGEGQLRPGERRGRERESARQGPSALVDAPHALQRRVGRHLGAVGLRGDGREDRDGLLLLLAGGRHVARCRARGGVSGRGRARRAAAAGQRRGGCDRGGGRLGRDAEGAGEEHEGGCEAGHGGCWRAGVRSEGAGGGRGRPRAGDRDDEDAGRCWLRRATRGGRTGRWCCWGAVQVSVHYGEERRSAL